MRIPLTSYAVPEILLFAVIFGGGAFAAWHVHPLLAVVPLLLLVFTVSFFRDPSRRIPGDVCTIVSPADGKVTDIVEVEDAPFVGGPSWRVGIFLSVFDVHVNRMPLAGTVLHRVHHQGLFLDARDEHCATKNEAVELGVEVPRAGEAAARILVRQVTGLIARRIVCPVRVGQTFERGARYGMIKFGSRTELYLADRDLEELAVKVGDKVKGGSSVIGRLRTIELAQKVA
jgi:phosphatidylserine decarboxylase